MQADHEEERKADKAMIAQLVEEALSNYAVKESLQTALLEAEADIEALKKQGASLYARLQSQTNEVDHLKKHVSYAFEAGVASFRQIFPHTEKGRQFITSARGQIIDRFLFSKKFCMMLANAAMPYCLHGFQNAKEQASGQGFSGELKVQDAVDSAPEIGWHGDEEEKEDFAWWEEVEQEILIEFSRLEIPTAELTSIDTLPLSKYAEPDPVHASVEPFGAQKDEEKTITQADPEEEEEEEEETQLIRRSRRSSWTSPASVVNPQLDT